MAEDSMEYGANARLSRQYFAEFGGKGERWKNRLDSHLFSEGLNMLGSMLFSLSINKGRDTPKRLGSTPNDKWRKCMGKVMNELGQWIRPVIVYIAGILIYNFLIVGNLIGIPGEFSSVEVDSKYKIACNFEIKNKGFFTIGSEKIQLNLPKEATILTVDIPRQYKLLYKIVDGGKNNNYAIFCIENLKGRESVKGSVIFFQFTKWEKDYINPISFSK